MDRLGVHRTFRSKRFWVLFYLMLTLGIFVLLFRWPRAIIPFESLNL